MAPRDFPISKKDADKHGYTRGCGGCSSWFRGLGRQPHTEGCRKRFEKLLKDTAKYKNWQERRRVFEEWIERKKRKGEQEGAVPLIHLHPVN